MILFASEILAAITFALTGQRRRQPDCGSPSIQQVNSVAVSFGRTILDAVQKQLVQQ